MGETGVNNLPKHVGFCCAMQAVILLSIGVAITIKMSVVNNVPNENTSIVTEITNNWNVIPFIDVRVTKDRCKSGEEPMIIHQWAGT